MNFKLEKPDKKRIISWLIYIAIIAVGILADHITKMIVINVIPYRGSVTVIKLFDKVIFAWGHIHNDGAAWGMFDDKPWVFQTVSAVAIIALTVYLFLFKQNNWLYGAAIPMIISGGIGNMIERLSKGYVVDFIHFPIINYPLFNVADSIVCIGAGLLILALILDIIKETKEERKRKAAVARLHEPDTAEDGSKPSEEEHRGETDGGDERK